MNRLENICAVIFLVCGIAICGLAIYGAYCIDRERIDRLMEMASAPKTVANELDRQRFRFHPEERIGGGYRNGKFVYLKDVK